MITEEEYRQYDKEIDEYIDKCVKDSMQNINAIYFRNTEKWQNDLSIKSLIYFTPYFYAYYVKTTRVMNAI